MERHFQLTQIVLILLAFLSPLLISASDLSGAKNTRPPLRGKSLNITEGNVVRIIAPSRKTPDTTLPLIKTYVDETLKLVANISDDIYSNEDPFYSNTDEYRANDLISALLDDNVRIIWCVRGGTGAIRLVPYLEAKLPAQLDHKILIGYSDITVLHLYFQYKYGWQTIQGPMLDAIATNSYNPSSESVLVTRALIFEEVDKVCWRAIKLNSADVTRIESRVVGGNAALVEASIGTVWEVKTTNRIFLMEDVGEAAYSIERSLDHMKQSGLFNGVDAVIFADFTSADNATLMDIVFDRFADWASFPVFRVTGIGHGSVNKPLPFLTHSVISIVNGMNYELCVDNIQSTPVIDENEYGRGAGDGVTPLRNITLLAIALVGPYFSYH